jgi:hypothetical protein
MAEESNTTTVDVVARRKEQKAVLRPLANRRPELYDEDEYTSAEYERMMELYQGTLASIDAVVYKLRTGPKRTTLFVMRSATMTGLPASPDMTPQHNTEGVCVGAWQTEGLVFVLVMEGSVHDYRSLLSDPLPIT